MASLARVVFRLGLLLALLIPPAQSTRILESRALAAAASSNSGLRVLISDLSRVRIELHAPEPVLEPDPNHPETYDLARIPGYGTAGEPGAPQLPVQGFLVGVPPGAEVELRITDGTQQSLPGRHRIAPAPSWELRAPPPELWESQVLTGNASRSLAQAEDPAIYSQPTYYPAAPVQVTEVGYIRHQRVAHLSFYPLQAHPMSGEIVFHSRVLLELTFHYPDGIPRHLGLAPVPEPDTFELFLRDSLVNYAAARVWRDVDPSQGAPALAQPAPPPDPGYRISLQDTGIYELSYTDLQAAGLPVDELDPRTLQIWYHGAEAAIRVLGEQDGGFDAGDSLLFFGEALSGPLAKYATENVYWLTYGSDNGRRMPAQDGTPHGDPTPATFEETLHSEQDVSYWSLMPGEDDDLARWYWASSVAPGQMVQSAVLTDVVTTTVMAVLTVAFHGYNDANADPDHHVMAYVNDNWVGEALWEGIDTYVGQFEFPPAYLQSGENLVRFDSVLDPEVSSSTNLLDWFEIRYRRAYQADQDQLAYALEEGGAWELQINGFGSPNVETFDVTQPLSTSHHINTVVEPSGNGYRLRFGDAAPAASRYWSLTPARRLSATSIQLDTASNLSAASNGADYVMITHANFGDAIAPLADYYASLSNLRVMVVDVQDVYDEFSGGLLYPGAIRAFLAYAFEHWVAPAPSYVLLVGDGHYDFRFLHPLTNQNNYLPPYMAPVDPWVGETATDNRYVSISGDDAWPDMHIGRFPVNSQAQTQAMVAKALAYQQNPPPGDWNRHTLFVTDNPDGAGDFYAFSDFIIDGFLPEPYTAEKIYYGQAPYLLPAETTAAIVAGISAGPLLVGYVGHAAIPWWAQEQLLRTSHVASLTNTTRWPFMVPMTCQEGQFSFFYAPLSSLSETIVRATDRGAIASWAPTGYGVASGHSYLQEGLFEALFTDGIRRLGDATLAGKRYLWEQAGGAHRELIETYLLLGDPYLQLYTLKTELGIEKEVIPSTPLQPADPLTYTLSVLNQGPASAPHVVITDLLPSFVIDAEVVSSTLNLSQRPGDPFVWDVQALGPGQTGAIVIRGHVNGAAGVGLFTNSAQIAAAAWETGTLPNQASVSSLVVAGPPALLQASADPSQIPVGGAGSTIEASVTDLWGNAVTDGTMVSFATTLGSISPSLVATNGGVASTTLTSGQEAGIATVTATAGNAQGSVQVPFWVESHWLWLPLVARSSGP